MKSWTASLLLVPLAGCAFPRTVQRISVEYNSAVAGTTNELVLQNILRAKEQLPIHYTALSRITGSFTVNGNGGFNASLKAKGTTDGASIATTDQTTNGTSPTGPSGSAVHTVANAVTSSIMQGGNAYTPSVGGSFSTGPSFDVTILNDQKFYQGISAAVPYSTIDNLIAQGFDSELVLRLFINRVTFKLSEDNPEFTRRKKGEVILAIDSKAGGANARTIANMMACFELSKTSGKGEGKMLGSLDRFTRGENGGTRPLDLKDLALFDGKQFDLDKAIAKPADDKDVKILRPGASEIVAKLTAKRSPLSDFGPRRAEPSKPASDQSETRPAQRLALEGDCYSPLAVDAKKLDLYAEEAGVLPTAPPVDLVFTAGGILYVPRDKDAKPVAVKADIEVTFRSTEGVIRFVGDYLRASADTPGETFRLRDKRLFSLVEGNVPDAFVQTTFLNNQYSIPKDAEGRLGMQVIAIIEQIINLQKSADLAPQTVPVRIIPGG